MSMDSTPRSKDTIWHTGLKRKIWQSVVYKRPILLTEISTGLEWKARRRFTMPMTPRNRQNSNTYIRQIGFNCTLVKWDNEANFILIKWAIHWKEMTIVPLYASNVSAPNFIKHTLKELKAHVDSKTVIVGDLILFNH
jgi:hypothetical protein